MLVLYNSQGFFSLHYTYTLSLGANCEFVIRLNFSSFILYEKEISPTT